MSKFKFTVGQEVETRSGDKARIICTDAKIGGGIFNLVALISQKDDNEFKDGNEFIEWYDERDISNGFVHCSGITATHVRDLKVPQAK
ncbi:MAG: hypothetical protein ACRCTP_04450 [Aeromonas popoffii]|uniref:hypothetical protein n=1 Tax=Aeromonas popoffii TaxID=70856 RepID=UPI003F3780AC